MRDYSNSLGRCLCADEWTGSIYVQHPPPFCVRRLDCMLTVNYTSETEQKIDFPELLCNTFRGLLNRFTVGHINAFKNKMPIRVFLFKLFDGRLSMRWIKIEYRNMSRSALEKCQGYIKT
jgi:hypothetical protein